MNFRTIVASIVIGLATVLASNATLAQGGQLRLLCSNGIRPAVEKLQSLAESEIGRKVSIEFSSSTLLQKQIDDGAPFDLVIVTPEIINKLASSSKVVTGSITQIASSDLAVGVKAGTAKPDITTAARLRARLLAAESVTWTNGGAAGPSVLAMFNALGIAEQMKPKIVLQTIPGRPAVTVAAGENELMFAPVSEIQTVQGVEVLGRVPKEFQQPVVMTAGIAVAASDADGARKLIAFLTSAKALEAMKSTGMDPPQGQ